MSEPFVYDPRYGLCKSPFGAAVCGTPVYFHCRPLASEDFTHCALVIHREFSGQREEREVPEHAGGGRQERSGEGSRESCKVVSRREDGQRALVGRVVFVFVRRVERAAESGLAAGPEHAIEWRVTQTSELLRDFVNGGKD